MDGINTNLCCLKTLLADFFALRKNSWKNPLWGCKEVIFACKIQIISIYGKGHPPLHGIWIISPTVILLIITIRFALCKTVGRQEWKHGHRAIDDSIEWLFSNLCLECTYNMTSVDRGDDNGGSFDMVKYFSAWSRMSPSLWARPFQYSNPSFILSTLLMYSEWNQHRGSFSYHAITSLVSLFTHSSDHRASSCNS